MAARSSSALRSTPAASRLGWEAALAGGVGLYALAWACWSVLHGYGFDDDGYSLVRVVQQLLAEHVYLPSRFQGAVVAELPMGLAAHLFGSLGSNLVVLACAIAGLAAFLATLRLYGIGCRGLVLAAIVSNGVVLIASATSMDYMVAFGIFAVGLYALASGEDVLGVVLLGLSAGARIFYISLAEVAVVFVLLERRRTTPVSLLHLASCMVCAFLVAGLCYLSVWFNHGLKFDWLNAARPTDQGLAGLAVRWAYKVVMFAGVPAIVLGALGWLLLDRREGGVASRGGPAGRPLAFAAFAVAVVALHLALFLWIPIDASYLIPALPFGAAVLAVLGWRGALAGLTIGQLISTLVVLDPLTIAHPAADVCMRSHATGVRLKPHIAPGLLVEDAGHRALAPRCGEEMFIIRPRTPTAPLPSQQPGDRGVIYPFTPPIEPVVHG